MLNIAPRLVERGYDVLVYCRSSHYPDKTPLYRGVQRVFLPTIEHKFLGQFIHASLAMLDAVRRHVDIIYVHTLPSAPLILIPAALRRTTVVNVDGMDWARGKWGTVGRAYFRAAQRISLRYATKVITDAAAMRQYYLDNFHFEMDWIAYGAEIESSDHPEVLKLYDLTPGSYFLIASRLVPENNPDLIVRAFEQSKTTKQLVIAGSSGYENPWVKSLHSTSDPRIRFLGHIRERSHVKELHCNSYAYIHGHSLGGTNPSLLKALGYGNCILALDTPFNREVLQDYGLLFDHSESSLSHLIDYVDLHSDHAATLRDKAPKRITQAYTWDRIVSQYDLLFKSIYALPRRRMYSDGSSSTNIG